jgi:hypothetical protein
LRTFSSIFIACAKNAASGLGFSPGREPAGFPDTIAEPGEFVFEFARESGVEQHQKADYEDESGDEMKNEGEKKAERRFKDTDEGSDNDEARQDEDAAPEDEFRRSRVLIALANAEYERRDSRDNQWGSPECRSEEIGHR